MKKQIFTKCSICFSVTTLLAGVLLVSSAFADYHQINAKRTKAPSFEMVGTVPLTQVGYGVPVPVELKKQSTTVGQLLDDVIPVGWRYYVSKTVNLESPMNVAAGTTGWIIFIEKLAEKLNLRTLVDWKAKAILIVSAHGESGESYFMNPRSDVNASAAVTMPEDLAPAKEVVTGDPMRMLNVVGAKKAQPENIEGTIKNAVE